MNTSANETLKPQVNGRHEHFERFVDSASQNQVIGSNTDEKNRDAVDTAVNAVENLMHDAILTAINDVIIPRVAIAVKLITG